MSFHGGLLGALARLQFLPDAAAAASPTSSTFSRRSPDPGILAGRIGNFINGELWGKPTDVPWGFSVDPAVLHPMQAAEARRLCERFAIDPCVLHVHASQLYEGLLEGLLLFVICGYSPRSRGRVLRPPACFCSATGCSAFIVEFVRVPDENRGYLLLDWVTMGQILSTPMILAGLALLANRLPPQPGERQPADADQLTCSSTSISCATSVSAARAKATAPAPARCPCSATRCASICRRASRC
jgi:phosphatidylglycerol:prolipoprotein diacylglycerol transferase